MGHHGTGAEPQSWRSWVPATVGRYELIARLASGGMGEVYIARVRGAGNFEKRVALKLLLPHLCDDPHFVQRFLDEARISARMDHPNIVQVFDQGEAAGRYFLTMALVRGVSLHRLIQAMNANGTRLPLPVLGSVARALCDGLGHAHSLLDERGSPDPVIHRDVSPGNVLISASGAILVTDFGVAKARDNLHRTATGHAMGKLAYMAPEQLGGGPVGPAADIFAAGVTLFEAATGVSPFRRPSDTETIEAVKSAPIPDALKYRADLPASVGRALERAMSRDPDARYRSMRELKQALSDLPSWPAEDLGALVQQWCGEALVEFDVASAADVQTATASPSIAAERPRTSPRRGLWLGAALSGVVAVGAAAALWHASEAPARLPAPVPQPAASAPVDAGLPAPPVQAASTPPPPQSEPAPHRKAGSASPERRVGYVTANAIPWATVFLGTQKLDQTPMSRYPLPVGEHVLVFKNPKLQREVRRTVRVRPGKVVTVEVDLEH